MDYSDEEPAARVVYESGSESDSVESDNDSDPIIRRVPVYYTPHYLNSLTLLQYPDRLPRPHTAHPLLPPALRPEPDQAALKPNQQLHVKHKPNTQHLSLSVPIERHEERWNEDDAAEFARGMADDDAAGPAGEDKKAKKRRGEDEERRREQEREDRRLDRMHMSSISVPDVTNYLVGVLKDGKQARNGRRRRVANRRAPPPPPTTRHSSALC